MMESVGLPCSYYQFSDQTELAPPFLCWMFESYSPMYADDANHADIRTLAVELYTDFKDFELEAQVEDILDAAGFAYGKDEDYLDSERMYVTVYTMDVVINKEED